ncbi:MAG: alcohol dehydrogenase catalytic domain-containing protein, partial [Chitinivibrionales bacterium]|nr:alcohol dehydrogenase catalytic domain-containing protein [Chitinivibrionales bacterium]
INDAEILLRVRAAGVCATDLKIKRNGHRKLKAGQQIVLGHEFVGEIISIGKNVQGFKTGQRVGVAPNIGCGRCQCCIQGKTNYCPDYQALGITLDGAHATHVKIPATFINQGNVVPMDEAVADSEAAILEPLSCVVGSLRAAKVEPGDTVVIYGAGPMGLLHVMMCAISGASHIVMVDPVAKRLDKARELGADFTFDPTQKNVPETIAKLTDGRGANVVFITCPVPKTQAEGLAVLAPFGRLMVFSGLPAGGDPVSLDTNAVHYRNLTICGTTGGSVQDYRAAMYLTATHRIKLSALVAATFPLDKMEAAYQTAQGGVEGKVVLLG